MRIFGLLVSGIVLGGTVLAAAALPRVGDAAPDFSVAASDGSTVRLRDVTGPKHIVLYFYPKDDTPGCTREACGIRDAFAEFRDLDATVYGVSFDSVESHRAFVAKYNLPFLLLADTDKKVATAYGVATPSSAVARRVTFIINKAGRIAFVFPNVNPTTHAAELRQALATLAD